MYGRVSSSPVQSITLSAHPAFCFLFPCRLTNQRLKKATTMNYTGQETTHNYMVFIHLPFSVLIYVANPFVSVDLLSCSFSSFLLLFFFLLLCLFFIYFTSLHFTSLHFTPRYEFNQFDTNMSGKQGKVQYGWVGRQVVGRYPLWQAAMNPNDDPIHRNSHQSIKGRTPLTASIARIIPSATPIHIDPIMCCLCLY